MSDTSATPPTPVNYEVDFPKCVEKFEELFLRAIRCSLWELTEELSGKYLVVAPGALNVLGINHDSDHELLQCWTSELTNRWGFYPYKVERGKVQFIHDECAEVDVEVHCLRIVFALTEKLGQHFLKYGCSQYDISALFERDPAYDTVRFPQGTLGHIFSAGFYRDTIYQQTLLADLQSIYSAIEGELLFQFLSCSHLSFD